jgi:hypothetical protein
VSNNEHLITLRDMILNKTLTQETFDKAQQMAKDFLEEKERKKQQRAEEHKRRVEKHMKPENFVPYEARSMHVEANRLSFEEKCQKCDLQALIHYTSEVKAGLHKQDFRGRDIVSVVQFLEAQIAKRKNNNNELLQSVKKANKTLDHIKEKLTPDLTEKSRAYTT